MRPLFQDAWKKGKRTAVPKVLGDGRMEFYVIRAFRELRPGFKGILEPVDGMMVTPVEHVFMIMPGVAFAKEGGRIGYGKGFYDRYLALHPNLLRAAVSFESQIVPRIPAGPYDMRPDWLITEARTIRIE